jgi:hypothetical protein
MPESKIFSQVSIFKKHPDFYDSIKDQFSYICGFIEKVNHLDLPFFLKVTHLLYSFH